MLVVTISWIVFVAKLNRTASFLSGCLMQLVSNTKLQLFCNQGYHSVVTIPVCVCSTLRMASEVISGMKFLKLSLGACS